MKIQDGVYEHNGHRIHREDNGSKPNWSTSVNEKKRNHKTLKAAKKSIDDNIRSATT